MSWIAVGMAAFGVVKSQVIDKPKEDRQRELAAKTQELSPWTGMQAGAIEEADPFGSALKYGGTGLSINSAMNQAAMDKALTSKLNSGGSAQIVKTSDPWAVDLGGSDVYDKNKYSALNYRY